MNSVLFTFIGHLFGAFQSHQLLCRCDVYHSVADWVVVSVCFTFNHKYLSFIPCHSVPQISKLPPCLLSSLCFLSLLVALFSLSSPGLSIPLCLFDVCAALTQTHSRLHSLWMLMDFLDCGCVVFEYSLSALCSVEWTHLRWTHDVGCATTL